MNYKDFFSLLLNNHLITPIWGYILELTEQEIDEEEHKDSYLILFAIYFSLLNDGNLAMSLDKNTLKEKWNHKLEGTQILLMDRPDYHEEQFEAIRSISLQNIDTYLQDINEKNLPTLFGEKRIFDLDHGWLYLKKYNVARKGIIHSLKRLFTFDPEITSDFNYRECVKETFVLSRGQEKAVVNGATRNLIITGGPGTGKTTSILFLLLNLLGNNNERVVYLVAPSGKASSRMKESILGNLKFLNDDYVAAHQEVIHHINLLEESTIHRLLEMDVEDGSFSYNRNHPFSEQSIFVIDEASMIDACLFNSLLEAIPDQARVFIMGDKNQLPSVECGAVFGELLKKESLKENIVELDESKRFESTSDIYQLASAVNNGDELPVSRQDWKPYTEFSIVPVEPQKPVFYYLDNDPETDKKTLLETFYKAWGKEYYASLQEKASDLDPEDRKGLDDLFGYTEVSKILTAENEGSRGVKAINHYMIQHFIDKTRQTSLLNYYAGELMMINKNNKALELYNGDSGVLVTFKNDRTLYYMVKKSSATITEDGKKADKIFKLGSYLFYPLRLISETDIDFSYAITIHKSQGSDYRNILVILPDRKGHPLLNRQIVYTAITRTKGNTYIVSNQDRLEEAKNTVMERDTNIATDYECETIETDRITE